MADQTAIAAVSRTLKTLLLDRMVPTANLAVTFAPPDISPNDAGGPRVNLYLIHVIESAELKNQESPFAGSGYGRPPLSLNLRYLMTTYSVSEDQADSDLNAQGLLGDAMRVLHDFGNRIDTLIITSSVAGHIGDPILDPALSGEFERLRLTLQPASIDDLTKIWSALSEANFRRSVIYEVTVVQIATLEPRVLPLPVQQRRILATLRRRPVIEAAYVTPQFGQPPGELRVRIGEEITIEAADIAADKLYVRLGTLDPIRVTAAAGRIRITVPDNFYPPDLDNPLQRPIPAAQQLQPGALPVQLLAQTTVEGVVGGLDHGKAATEVQSLMSNLALLQLVPSVATAKLVGSPSVLRVNGNRLWHPAAHTVEVVVGDTAVSVRVPGPSDPWAAATPTQIEVLPTDAASILGSAVAVEVDGARSRDTVTVIAGP
jgi:hypothetical protein